MGRSTLMLEIDLPQVKTSVVADKKDTREYQTCEVVALSSFTLNL